ncbi:hypothetical protein V5799_019787 [Amblyomma americanum]|uniref:Uncharacterized protein n=1 Tax=Amblyomma americanum TaxID=6943 RepID=A0AAQ4EW46_AMBAM
MTEPPACLGKKITCHVIGRATHIVIASSASSTRATLIFVLSHVCRGRVRVDGLSMSSKVSRDTLYDCVNAVLQESARKHRKFLETVELQIALKNYDPQKDKRFSGTVKYACSSTSIARKIDLKRAAFGVPIGLAPA